MSTSWAEVRQQEKALLKNLRASDAEIGLALSGGGIRSATFSLGVLQYLAQRHWLRHVDYLSTVSGGGYIGGWLSALIYRKRLEIDRRSVQGVGGELQSSREESVWNDIEEEVTNPQSESVRWIRNHSNYITPRTGLSEDTFSTVGLVITNLLLSIGIVFALASIFALFSLSVGTGFGYLAESLAKGLPTALVPWWPSWLTLSRLPWLISSLFLFLGTMMLRTPIEEIADLFREERSHRQEVRRPKVPLILAGSCYLLALASFSVVTGYAIASGPGWSGILPAKIQVYLDDTQVRPVIAYIEGAVMWGFLYLFGISWVVLFAWRELWRGDGYWSTELVGNRFLTALFVPIKIWFAGAIAGLVIVALSQSLRGHLGNQFFIAGVLGVVVTVTGVTVALGVHMMLFGRELPQVIREMWHRVVGGLAAGTMVWVALLGLTVLAPALFNPETHEGLQVGVIVAWLGSSVAGGLIALGRYVGARSEGYARWLALTIVPPMFVAGLLLFFFALTLRLRFPVLANPKKECSSLIACSYDVATTLSQSNSSPGSFLITLMSCVGVALLLLFGSRLYNVNWHSLYYLYRDRLVRCFLGASNVQRKRTAARFDPNDDLRLSALAGQRPFHVFCSALNLSGSHDLMWQTRKATSFFFSPLYCGYLIPRARRVIKDKTKTPEFIDEDGFIETRLYMTPLSAKDTLDPWRTQATVGTAMTISGAAMTPSCGYHTNRIFAFLMGVFNVRLGRWCPNPLRRSADDVIRRADPQSGIWWFVRELFGLATEKSAFVYLSDGGHFENTGLYELVRRRCRHIVVVDAECDPKLQFEGLTEAVRKCRLDLNAEIDIDPSVIRPETGGDVSPQSYCVGEITYYESEHQTTTGTLVYLKLSVPSLEKSRLPIDVLGYKAAHPTFPYERTSDQWFDENQFESYRKLGKAVARQTFECSKEAIEIFCKAG